MALITGVWDRLDSTYVPMKDSTWARLRVSAAIASKPLNSKPLNHKPASSTRTVPEVLNLKRFWAQGFRHRKNPSGLKIGIGCRVYGLCGMVSTCFNMLIAAQALPTEGGYAEYFTILAT